MSPATKCLIAIGLLVLLSIKSTGIHAFEQPCDTKSCTPIEIDVPREILEHYSVIDSVIRNRLPGKSFIRFVVRSQCPMLSVKVTLESIFVGRPDIVLIAQSKGNNVYEVPVNLPRQPHAELMALQIVAVSNSGEAAAFVDLIIVPTNAMGSGGWPETKVDWWAKKLKN